MSCARGWRRALGQRARKRRKAAEVTGGDDFVARYRARGEARNEAARAALEPLKPGERPLAVTLGAIVAAISGVVNLGLTLAGVEVRGEEQELLPQALTSGLLLLMAWGMWRARYWAVLGMEALLGITILLVALFVILEAGVVTGLLLTAAVLAPAGALFWFLVRAMARIQMPERR